MSEQNRRQAVSDTPRTDAKAWGFRRMTVGSTEAAIEWACELERQVAELREALEYACEAEWDGIHEPVWMKRARAALKGKL